MLYAADGGPLSLVTGVVGALAAAAQFHLRSSFDLRSLPRMRPHKLTIF